MKTLLVWLSVPGFQWSQKPEIPIWSEGAEYETKAMDKVSQGLWFWVTLPSR